MLLQPNKIPKWDSVEAWAASINSQWAKSKIWWTKSITRRPRNCRLEGISLIYRNKYRTNKCEKKASEFTWIRSKWLQVVTWCRRSIRWYSTGITEQEASKNWSKPKTSLRINVSSWMTSATANTFYLQIWDHSDSRIDCGNTTR